MTVVSLRIGSILKERELTQSKLSEMTGIRQSAISKLARGYIDRLSIDHLQRIANALSITDINELIRLEDDN